MAGELEVITSSDDVEIPLLEEVNDSYDPLKALDIDYASSKLNELETEWESIVRTQVEKDRNQRFQKIDVKAKRASQELLSDETFITVRAIEASISRSKPAFLSYLRGPTNLVMFVKPEDPGSTYEDLEIAFDRGIKYPAWDEPFIECIDSMLAHGLGAIEVLFDENAPLHVSMEYVSKNDIIFHTETHDIQQQQYVMRRYKWTKVALESHGEEFGFDDKAVRDLCNCFEQENTIDVFKVYIKTSLGLHIAWWTTKKKEIWLREPEPYTVGFVGPDTTDPLTGDTILGEPIPETYIPLFVLPKDLIEDTKLLSVRGVCFLQSDVQYSVSAIQSGVVNGVLKASNPIFSPKSQMEMGQQDPITVRSGYVAKVPLEMHVTPYPSSDYLIVIDQLRRQAMEDAGHVDFSLGQSPSSRMTATEAAAAQSTQANLNSVSVLNLSNFIRNIYTYTWRIVQNEAMNDRVNLLGQRDQNGVFVNDKTRIEGHFLVLASGDREFIRRKEAEQALKEFYPLVQGTPLGRIIIADALTYSLPSLGQKYRYIFMDAIKSQDMTLGILQGFLERLQNGMQTPSGSVAIEFTPDEITQLAQTNAEYQRIFGLPGAGQEGLAQSSTNNSPPQDTQTPGVGSISS